MFVESGQVMGKVCNYTFMNNYKKRNVYGLDDCFIYFLHKIQCSEWSCFILRSFMCEIFFG